MPNPPRSRDRPLRIHQRLGNPTPKTLSPRREITRGLRTEDQLTSAPDRNRTGAGPCRAGRSQDHPALVCPEVHVARDELAALIDADRRGLACCSAHPVERGHNIFAAIAVANVQHVDVAREGIDHGQNPQLLARGQLVVNEFHRPNVIRPDGQSAVIPQPSFHPPQRRLVPELLPRTLRSGRT